MAVGHDPAPRSAVATRDPQERERRFEQDRFGCDERRRHGKDGCQIGQQVPEQDARSAGARQPRRLNEFGVLEREHLAAHDPGHGQPLHQPQGDKQHQYALRKKYKQDDDQKQIGQRVEEIHKAHHPLIRPPAAALTASAIPKSATMGRPSCNKMFSGLMSRWMTLLRWA